MKKIACLLIIIAILFSSVNIAASYQIYKKEENNNLNRFDYDQKYAVIIVGTYGAKNQERITGMNRELYYFYYTGSAMRRFNLLTEKYGFDENNIYVLLTEVKKEGYNPHDNFDSSKFIKYFNATKENITMVFNELKTKIDEDDFLVVDLIGHGADDNIISIPIFTKLTGKYFDKKKGINAHDTFLPLEKENGESEDAPAPRFRDFMFKSVNLNYSCSSGYKLYDHELASLTTVINARRVLFILQPCHSGGFINDLSNKNHVIITSCAEGEVSGDFLGPFNNGLDGDADFPPVDGRTSLAEVFTYASKNIDEYYPNIYPLIDDNGDKVGHKHLDNSDGSIASRIFDLSYEEIEVC